jgi:hypothetical protein
MKVMEAVWATCKKLNCPFLIILAFLLFSFPLNFSHSSAFLALVAFRFHGSFRVSICGSDGPADCIASGFLFHA